MDCCTVEGCTEPIKVKSRGLCRLHYERFTRHGDPAVYKRKQRATCSVDGCDVRTAALGYCDMHYRRIRRYGTTEAPARPVECAVDGCSGSVVSREMCETHYRRVLKGGDAEPPRSCRQCGADLAGMTLTRRFCNRACYEAWMYHERRRTHRDRWLARYGLTVDQYNEMVASQEGRCGICRGEEPMTNGGVHWCVDHCHETGAVRGLLCHDCNIGLGKFRDDPSLLQAAITYLTK